MLGEGFNLAKALAGRNSDNALILLAHQPAAIDEAAALCGYAIDLFDKSNTGTITILYTVSFKPSPNACQVCVEICQ